MIGSGLDRATDDPALPVSRVALGYAPTITQLRVFVETLQSTGESVVLEKVFELISEITLPASLP